MAPGVEVKSRVLTALAFFYAVLFYYFMEGLFIITKPSYLTAVPLPRALVILGAAFSPYVIGVGLFIGFGETIISLLPRWEPLVLKIRKYVTAFALGLTFYIMVNNFMYTLFSVEPLSSRSLLRVFYPAFLITLCFYFYYLVRGLLGERLFQRARPRILLIKGAVIISLVSFGAVGYRVYDRVGHGAAFGEYNLGTPRSRPNIIIMSSDALWADNLSVYGYKRDTTPFLSRFMKQKMLIFDNAYSNANRSSGSLMSMLSGKHPLRIRVLIYPDILTGRDSYEHLPGILRRYGYSTLEMSCRDWADSYDLNMRYAFANANYRHLDNLFYKIMGKFPRIYNSGEFYLLNETFGRAANIIKYSFGLESHRSIYWQLTGGYNSLKGDEKVVESIKQFISNSQRPFFIHLHLLGTHGPHYQTRHKVFSRTRDQDRGSDIDFYDDAILDFDEYIQEIVKALAMAKILDNTLLVIHSDHSRNFNVHYRVPLIFIFPHRECIGRIKANVQLLDIAPTIIDYMGLRKPPWMAGRSLIKDRLDAYYPIIAAGDYYPAKNEYLYIPPFGEFRFIEAIICHKWFQMDLMKKTFSSGEVAGHRDKCPDKEFPTDEEIKRLLIDRLRDNGFSLETLLGSRLMGNRKRSSRSWNG